MNTDELVQELINRIGDFTKDPEPKADDFLETVPVHARLSLEFALKLAQGEYQRLKVEK